MRKALNSIHLRSIGSRIAVSVIVLLVLAVGVVGWLGYTQQKELSTQSVEIRLKGAYERVLEELKVRERLATALAQTIANYPGIGEHIEKFDRQWILDAITPTYRIAHDQNGLFFTDIFQPPGINMLRFHSLKNMGGDDVRARRQTVVQALATGKPQVGLEPGLNSLGMFAVVPVRIGDRIVGALDVGTSIVPELADALKKRLGIDIAFHAFADNKFETVAGTIPNKSLLTGRRSQSGDGRPARGARCTHRRQI